MNATLLHRLSMIPRLTAPAGEAERLARSYTGWDLLKVDDSTEEILICKPCAPAWLYTRSKHALILCGEAAAAWRRNSVSTQVVLKMSTAEAKRNRTIRQEKDFLFSLQSWDSEGGALRYPARPSVEQYSQDKRQLVVADIADVEIAGRC